MALSNKPTENELIDLRDSQILESKIIDYKLGLSINTDEEKKEFLADITSFANTLGGHLIMGMKEDKGLPVELLGVQIDDTDKTKLRLEEIIRGGISPRIAGVVIHVVQLKNCNWAIVIYVPKSWSAPHMVSFKKISRFYARNSAGKYQLDVQEIRQAFLLSESIENKIRDFRLDRVAKINVGDTPTVLNNNPKIVLHSIPLASYQMPQVFEISDIQYLRQR
ncbi:MAG: ATP-binding protein [Anaerolineales bacterium]|nr:ATP-binding protein [Anaerolineales bacterium]